MADMELDGSGAPPAAVAKATDLSNADFCTKQKEAASIANQALKGVLTQLIVGKDIAEICDFGDSLIEQLCAPLYKAKKLEKGVAFPTSVSVNECVGHFSPLKSESKVLADGDVVKVDLGVHIDGHIALVAHTVVLGASAERLITGVFADTILAAHHAAEIAVRMIKPGVSNSAVSAELERVAATFGVKAITGVTSHQLQQFVIEGPKKIALQRDPENKTAECVFAANETYAIDVCFSSGDGKPRETVTRTTIFKRTVDVSYHPKMKASQKLFNDVRAKHPTLPFTLRSLGDERDAKLGVTECVKHGLFGAYPVNYERDGSVVAHFRFTVLLLPGGTQKVTGLDAPEFVKSEKVLTPESAVIRASIPYVAKAKKEKAVAAPVVVAAAADIVMN